MAELLIPDLDEEVKSRLEKRARRNSRSAEAEARIILEEATAQTGFEEAGEAVVDRSWKRISIGR